MPCIRINDDKGKTIGFARVSGSRPSPCKWCPRPHTKLCDYRAAGAKKTCDAKMCDLHAKNVGPELDLCPVHADAPVVRRPL